MKLALIPIILLCFNIFLNMKLISLLGNSILFSVILYNLVLFLKYNNRIEQEKVKSIFRILFAFTVLFFPYMFLDTKTDYIKFLSKYFPYGLLSVVKTHIRNIYQKTEVNNKIELLKLLKS